MQSKPQNKPLSQNTKPQNQNPYQRMKPLECFRCSQPSHKFNECSQRRPSNVVDTLDEADNEFGKDEVAEGEIEYPIQLVDSKQGDPLLCILQKLLFTHKHA